MNHHIPRIYLPDIRTNLSNDQKHHLCKVLKLRNGDNIYVFDANENEYTATLNGNMLNITDKIKSIKTLPKHIVLYCAITKGIYFRNIVRFAVEMGVHTLQPVITDHVVCKPPVSHKVKKHIISATEQCGRVNIMKYNSPIHFYDAFETDQNTFICDETVQYHSQKPLYEIFSTLKTIHLMIGPEGGFSEKELFYKKNNLHRISISPFILRVDTAVAVSIGYALQ
ncbi:MAG: RNA methyltransferase family protein [Candidatus Xenolissoclinum pacificiensis L6]|uniref:Ribosomal RNA small subunit methyltransferase E n=1 Tax=Candidatus Xenolissoclinum pacificiensis L6 TaxID=1401685 RepID=W2UZ40_9RICK|nr:MAG: RNA methyltransferase family protein [Candidatus Xenolissoclinum pacificiensis L6]